MTKLKMTNTTMPKQVLILEFKLLNRKDFHSTEWLAGQKSQIFALKHTPLLNIEIF